RSPTRRRARDELEPGPDRHADRGPGHPHGDRDHLRRLLRERPGRTSGGRHHTGPRPGRRRPPRYRREDPVMFDRPGCASGCPYLPSRSDALDFPIGQVRRMTAVREEGDDVDETRRNVLKLAGVGALVLAGGGLGAAAIQYVQPPAVGLTSYPKVQLIDVNGKPLTLTA